METQYTQEYLFSKNINELIEICIELRINRFNNRNKQSIIRLILTNQKNQRVKISLFNKISKKFMFIFCDKKKDVRHPSFNDVEEEDDDKQCVICFKNKKILAGECGHLCLCGNCSKSVWEQKESLCPICRNEWKKVRKIFV